LSAIKIALAKAKNMAKVYSMGKSPTAAFIPFPEENIFHQQNEKSRIEKFALRWLKIAIFSLILTMVFLVVTQQFLNQNLLNENEKLRKQNLQRLMDNELLAHPLFEKYSKEFENFKQTFEKSYESHHEEHHRKLIFLNRMQEIEELNNDEKNLLGNEYAPTQFADMTDEEMKKMLLPLDYYQNLRKHASFIRPYEEDFHEDDLLGRYPQKGDQAAAPHPAHLDWREKGVVTPVKSQLNCGSCWAFATVATVESAYAVAHGQLRNLSEQELLDCNMDNNACDGGDVDKAFQFVHERGLMFEDAYPYVAKRQNTCAIATESEKIKIDVAYWLNPTEDAMVDWLNTYGPVNVGISVPPSMKFYKSGVYTPSPYDCKFKSIGLHALLAVGYGQTEDGEKYWIVKNSWGQKWGTENGYVYFARGQNACGIEDEPIGILA
jgi:cathepsin F